LLRSVFWQVCLLPLDAPIEARRGSERRRLMKEVDSRASELHEAVRERYASVARDDTPMSAEPVARAVGYTEEQLAEVPEGANLGLGCGNPVALAALRPGQVVLDLGSGAGFDAFLAVREVGPTGRVIGVDMTDEMLDKARANAAKLDLPNVEFRKGTIEDLPVEDRSVDMIISNCVINLSPDKPRVFSEAHRVLRPGGRLMISDLVSLGELPAAIRESISAYVGCIAGISLKEDYVTMLQAAGFDNIEIVGEKDATALLGSGTLDTPSCATADPVFGGIVSELMKSVSIEDLLAAAKLVVSVQVAATKRGSH
jgi:SAM-dependent methyltransferase